MKKLFLILTILFGIIYPGDYLWPNDYENSITTTFAEPRFRRFHAGIDIRTKGEIGSNIYAIYNGYISRIKIESDNYGKAIYLKLDDGNIVLYSHLSKFNTEIETLVKKLQKKYNSSFFDHTLDNTEHIKLTKGEIIGYTGDTGSLSGPHIHFEIRDEFNQPINPLLKYYTIDDTLPPIANSISFIPLSSKTWINGIQDYQTIGIKKINDNKYVIQDTLSIQGEFGIALETYDIINNLDQFKFGIYNIQLLIDNIEYYSIKFDKYNFSENPLIYTEIDYMLVKNNNLSHRLFNNAENNLSFIKTKLDGRINLDKKFHNLIINVFDANNNQIQIQGILTGKSNPIINAEIKDKNNIFEIMFEKNDSDRIFFKKESKLLNVNNTNLMDTLKLNDDKFVINNFDPNIDIIEYFVKNKNGVSSRKSYISSNKLDPYKIKGNFNITHIDDGLIINFTEDVFSGYTPKLIIHDGKDLVEYDLYRKNKNTLSSTIISASNINKISIKYNSKPQMIFTKEIETFKLDSDSTNNYTYNQYKMNFSDNTFYNKTLIWVEKPEYKINDYFTEISNPILINPTTLPFKEKIKLSYKLSNCEHCAFYQYNIIKEIWEYSFTNHKDNLFNTKITSGGIFAILKETIKPKIYNLTPTPNSKYRQKDINKIKFNVDDEESGINEKKIKILIDNQVLFYDYIHYRKLAVAELDTLLSPGKHSIEILVYDNVNNQNRIKGEFVIIE